VTDHHVVVARAFVQRTVVVTVTDSLALSDSRLVCWLAAFGSCFFLFASLLLRSACLLAYYHPPGVSIGTGWNLLGPPGLTPDGSPLLMDLGLAPDGPPRNSTCLTPASVFIYGKSNFPLLQGRMLITCRWFVQLRPTEQQHPCSIPLDKVFVFEVSSKPLSSLVAHEWGTLLITRMSSEFVPTVNKSLHQPLPRPIGSSDI
jgi:hypothetical protein